MIAGLGPYVLPNANLDFTFITVFDEVFFTLWALDHGLEGPGADRNLSTQSDQ